MTREEILEFNERCAEFLGWETAGPGFFAGYWNGKDFIQFHELKFHSDWNWIMEVVDAIEKIGNHGFTIYRQSTNINGLPFEISNSKSDSKKEAVVQAINQFLIWYNTKKS